MNFIVQLLSGKIISDSFENIKIKVTNNDYDSPEYIFTLRDIDKISYFIKIKNEEFYISRMSPNCRLHSHGR